MSSPRWCRRRRIVRFSYLPSSSRSLARSFARARAYLDYVTKWKWHKHRRLARANWRRRRRRRRRSANSHTAIHTYFYYYYYRYTSRKSTDQWYDTASNQATCPIFLEITSPHEFYPVHILKNILVYLRYMILLLDLNTVIWCYILFASYAGWIKHVLP